MKLKGKEDQIGIAPTIQIFVLCNDVCRINMTASNVCDDNIRAGELSQSLLIPNMMLLFEFFISSEIS